MPGCYPPHGRIVRFVAPDGSTVLRQSQVKFALQDAAQNATNVTVFGQIKFETAGVKLVKNRVTVLRLWLQLWDARMGHLVWESTGEITAASELLTAARAVPLDEIAQKLWLRMIQDNLLEGKTESRFLFSN